jgi:hypothetical protein
MMGGRENSSKNAKCAVVAQNEIPTPKMSVVLLVDEKKKK